jgi:hypothetical protein
MVPVIPQTNNERLVFPLLIMQEGAMMYGWLESPLPLALPSAIRQT